MAKNIERGRKSYSNYTCQSWIISDQQFPTLKSRFITLVDQQISHGQYALIMGYLGQNTLILDPLSQNDHILRLLSQNAHVLSFMRHKIKKNLNSTRKQQSNCQVAKPSCSTQVYNSRKDSNFDRENFVGTQNNQSPSAEDRNKLMKSIVTRKQFVVYYLDRFDNYKGTSLGKNK